uniref:Tumor necrosis factor receptor superfamily member 12A n=1 Tax=Gopherus evgoodei TaxID=1825980 RepID=A0A8C4YBJ2_9SAUR
CFLSFLLPLLPCPASLLPFPPPSSFLPLYPPFRLTPAGGGDYSSFSGPSCPGGQSWSPDLDKCMDCTICLHRTKNDFCATCGEPQPQDSRLWLAVGGTVGGVAVLGLVGGALLWARCRKREKFTSE